MVAIPWLVLVTTGAPPGWLWPRSNWCRTSSRAFMAGPIIDNLGHAVRRSSRPRERGPRWSDRSHPRRSFGGATRPRRSCRAHFAARADRAKDLLVAHGWARQRRTNPITSCTKPSPAGATLLAHHSAGWLIFWTDAARVLWIDAATFVICGVLGSCVRPSTRVTTDAKRDKDFRSLARRLLVRPTGRAAQRRCY